MNMKSKKMTFDVDIEQLVDMFGESVRRNPQKTLSQALEFYASAQKYDHDGRVYVLDPTENAVVPLDAWGVEQALASPASCN